MRKLLLFLLLCVPTVSGQDLPSKSLTKGSWDIGLWTSFGNGLGKRTDHQFFLTGLRVGRVLTAEHGRGWLRGNFELAGDVVPIGLIFPDETVYAVEIRPLIFKWNFTRGKKVAPFLEGGGGLLFTSKDFPRPATINFNFTPQFAGGFQIFTREKRAVTLGVRAIHVSNASLSAPNPGINAVLVFTVGYHWFK